MVEVSGMSASIEKIIGKDERMAYNHGEDA